MTFCSVLKLCRHRVSEVFAWSLLEAFAPKRLLNWEGGHKVVKETKKQLSNSSTGNYLSLHANYFSLFLVFRLQ